jgi:hypothetical protein
MKEIDDDNSGSIELAELRQWLAVHHTDDTEGSLAVALRSEVPCRLAPPPPPSCDRGLLIQLAATAAHASRV